MAYQHVCLCTKCMLSTSSGQNMASDLGLELDGCELPCGFWEPDLSSLEDEQVILTTEISAQSQKYTHFYHTVFKVTFDLCMGLLEFHNLCWRQGTPFWGWLSSSISWFLGIELRSLGLAVSAFTHWAIFRDSKCFA